MAFPATQLDLTVELDVGGWTDVTSDVLVRDGITISRGRMSEGSQAGPTSCGLSVRNDGTYSPRNPLGTYYGVLGRNTPLRTYLGTPHLGAGGGSGTASTSHVAPSVPATGAGLLVCGWMADDPVDYTVPVSMTAGPETDGTFSTMRTGYEAVSAGATGTRTATASSSEGYASVSAVAHGTSVAVEETLSGVSSTIDDVTLTTDAGTQAGWWLLAVQGWVRGFDVGMPDAPYGDDGGWILLGDSGRITGDFSGIFTTYLRTRVWVRRVNTAGAQKVIFPGIADTAGVNADNHAALYVLSGVTGWDLRATAEVPAWPSRWDTSGSDVWVPIQAQGIMRRLQQGASPLRSPLRRAITGAGATVWTGHTLLPAVYWPLEDGTDSTQAASGLAGGTAMALSGGTVDWAQVASPGSAAVPNWGGSGGGSLVGQVSGLSGVDWTVGCLVQYTDTDAWTAVTVTTSGTYRELRLKLTGSVAVDAVDSSGTTSTIMSSATDLSDGDPHWVEIVCAESGGVAFFDLYIDGDQVDSASVAGSRGNPATVMVSPRGSGTAGLGHVGLWQGGSVWNTLVSAAVIGHAGEAAGRRVERLCHEAGVPIHIVGDADDTVAMGPQTTATLLELVRECEAADGGILYEPREVLGLGYRCASALYNQPITLALTYGADGEVAPDLEPTDDDQRTRNDVTVTRSGGSSARVEITSGPLSTADPPDGVGRYDTDDNLNVHTDDQLADLAGWRAHLGTWDEARYPQIRVDLAALGKAGKTTLAAAAVAVDVGDRVTVGSLPAWLPPDGADQHVEGTVETLLPRQRSIALVCTPAGPWQVAVVADADETAADDEQRVCADSSTLTANITSSAMSLQITSPDDEPWTTDAADFPLLIRVGGEVIRLSAISGTASPWTATVDTGGRAVNGVSKAHAAGVPVDVAYTAILGL